MSKYSFEFKLKVVQNYYSGVGGKKSYRELANDLQINNPSLITQKEVTNGTTSEGKSRIAQDNSSSQSSNS